MSEVTVRQLADVVGIQPDRLLEQMKDAGLVVSDIDAAISNQEKMQLLAFLRTSHGKGDNDMSSPQRITLKRKSSSALRISGAAGKQKTVNVEFRKKRTYVKRKTVQEQEVDDPGREEAIAALKVAQERRAAEDAERLAREEEKARLESEAKAAQEAEERAVKEAEEKARREVEEQERLVAEEKARQEAEEKAQREKEEKEKQRMEKAKSAPPPSPPTPETPRREGKKRDKGRAKGRADAATRYGRAELHVTGDRAGRRKKPGRGHPAPFKSPEKHGFSMPTAPVVHEVEIGETITVSELAQRMAIKSSEVIKVLMNMGAMVTINQPIDQDTAALVVEEMGHKVKTAVEKDIETELVVVSDDDAERVPRPPVVTVMGHVDHGKTSLLDYIRKAKVVDGEAGGITQHIGAYSVDTPHGRIAFLDTPGHAAFTAMRARGAKATDIVILVVAADDGVKPQTKEAIQHARAAEVPVIVAVNKIDRAEADLERVRNELSAEEVIPEEWGGEDIFVNVSAITGEGIDALLEAILLQAEVMELGATPDAPASGVVVEATLDKGRGTVATLLVQNGTLRRGDTVLCGQEFGRVRAMSDDSGRQVDEAGPSTPVAILGLSGTPNAGDEMLVVADERKARDAALTRQDRSREDRLKRQQAAKLENLFSNMGEGEQKSVNLLIKADVQGSVEALRESLTNLSNEEVAVNIISAGVGGVTESDATLALASNAILIGFNVRADATARRVIADSDMEINYYSVIYEAIDDVKAAITGVLGTEIRESIIGLAEVKDVFRSSKIGAIAGCIVIEGVVRKRSPIRVLRDNVVIFEGELESLRRFKDDVDEVKAGTECGIGVKQYNDVKAGDQVECFDRVEVARTLD